jgi:hypothetical protein
MTNLKDLSSQELLTKTKDLVAREREVTTQVLWHLREIESRRLFAMLGFSSLFDYAVKELGYSEGSAMRRINAMRFLKEIPQAEKALQEGKLTLSHLSSVQTFLQHEKRHEGKSYSDEQKLELVKGLEGTSQRETERILVALSPESVPSRQDRVRPLTETHAEFKAVISAELLQKLERVKELAAHRLKSGSWAEVLELMADQTIEVLDPARAKVRRAAPPAPESADMVAKAEPSRSRYIPKALKKSIFDRAGGQCEFKDPQSGRRCSCKTFLQVDHIKPLALGGITSDDNLRILCQAHNQWEAMQSFGRKKMEQHWQRS